MQLAHIQSMRVIVVMRHPFSLVEGYMNIICVIPFVCVGRNPWEIMGITLCISLTNETFCYIETSLLTY